MRIKVLGADRRPGAVPTDEVVDLPVSLLRGASGGQAELFTTTWQGVDAVAKVYRSAYDMPRAQTEYELLKRLTPHQFAPHPLAFASADDRPVLVQTFLEGTPLDGITGLDDLQLWHVARGCAANLVSLHLSGITHRDGKGANVLVRLLESAAGPVVQSTSYVDFGIGRLASATFTDPSQTPFTTGFVSAERYAARDLAEHGDVDLAGNAWAAQVRAGAERFLSADPDVRHAAWCADDVWALGAMLLQHATRGRYGGQLPYGLHDDRRCALRGDLQIDLDRDARLPPWLQQVLRGTLEPDPGLRLTASELLALVDHVRPRVEPDPVPPPAPQRRRRGPLLAAAALVAVAGVAGPLPAGLLADGLHDRLAEALGRGQDAAADGPRDPSDATAPEGSTVVPDPVPTSSVEPSAAPDSTSAAPLPRVALLEDERQDLLRTVEQAMRASSHGAGQPAPPFYRRTALSRAMDEVALAQRTEADRAGYGTGISEPEWKIIQGAYGPGGGLLGDLVTCALPPRATVDDVRTRCPQALQGWRYADDAHGSYGTPTAIGVGAARLVDGRYKVAVTFQWGGNALS